MRKNLTRTVDPLRDTAQQLLYIEIFCERRCVNMEKYAKAQMEVIEFENEDVITTSGNCTIEGYGPGFGSNDPNYPGQGL
jgi:hypothetical protein